MGEENELIRKIDGGNQADSELAFDEVEDDKINFNSL